MHVQYSVPSTAGPQGLEQPRPAQPGRGVAARANIRQMQQQTRGDAAGRVRRPLAWAALASVVVSAIGAAAIYLIHDTMPAPRDPLAAARSPGSSAAQRIEAAGVAPRAEPLGQGTDHTRAAASHAAGGGSTRTPGSSDDGTSAGIASNRDLSRVAGGEYVAPARAPAGRDGSEREATGRDGSAPGIAAVPADNRRSSSPEPAGRASAARPAAAEVPQPAGAGREEDRQKSRTGSARAPTGADAVPGRAEPRPRPPGAPLQQGNAPPTNAPVQAARDPAPGAPAPRLAAQQQAQCADTSYLSRLVCDERVRLRFCRDRWNEHPDCMVEPPRTSF